MYSWNYNSAYCYFPCPVDESICRRPKIATYWYHHKCGSKTKLNFQNLYVFCQDCQQYHLMFEWFWSCGDHRYERPANNQSRNQKMITCLACLGQQKGVSHQQIKMATNCLMNQHWLKQPVEVWARLKY